MVTVTARVSGIAAGAGVTAGVAIIVIAGGVTAAVTAATSSRGPRKADVTPFPAELKIPISAASTTAEMDQTRTDLSMSPAK